jgi:transposase
VALTPSQAGDAPAVAPAGQVAAGKAYDSGEARAEPAARGIGAVIPPGAGRKRPIAQGAELYEGRNRVERLAGKAKQPRAIAARCGKLDVAYLARSHLVAAFIKLR